jgi:hypothetical protein
VLQRHVLYAEDVRGLQRAVRTRQQQLWRHDHVRLRWRSDLLPRRLLHAVVLGQVVRLERRLRKHLRGNGMLIERMRLPIWPVLRPRTLWVLPRDYHRLRQRLGLLPQPAVPRGQVLPNSGSQLRGSRAMLRRFFDLPRHLQLNLAPRAARLTASAHLPRNPSGRFRKTARCRRCTSARRTRRGASIRRSGL